MIRLPPQLTRTDTLCPAPTLFRSLEARLTGERADPQRERGVVGGVGTGGGMGHGSASLERALHFAAPSRAHGPPRCSVAGLAKANGLACGPRLASRRPVRAGKHSKAQDTL